MARPELPSTGNANTSVVRLNKKGKIIQRRYYDGDGRAIKNVDFEAHHGAPNPHIHDWDWTKTPPRQPYRLPKKGEPV
jgi:hypothetical protein